jgi:GntR family transcriptional regulator, transcriptional repressor for pyruvate dehydrogenase complex
MKETDAIFTPAQRVRTFEDVVEQIRNAVLDGRIEKGARLPNERELCRIFGISRSTLREGLRALEALGVVEVRPGAAGGAFATEPRADQVGLALEAMIRFSDATARDLAELRVSFEGETAYWAAQRATSDDIAALEEIVREYSTLIRDDGVPWPVLAALDVRFHDTIAQASHNQVRVAIMLGISRALFRASSSLEPYVDQPLRRSIGRELAGIVAAVSAHDDRLARLRMRRHVKKFSDLESRMQDTGRL